MFVPALLAPLQIIHCLKPAARLEAFTLLSGSQMLGMGMGLALAAPLGLPVAVASQVFTLGYFAGAFGFPYVAGSLIAACGVDAMFFVMLGLMGVNIAVAWAVPGFRYGLPRSVA